MLNIRWICCYIIVTICLNKLGIQSSTKCCEKDGTSNFRRLSRGETIFPPSWAIWNILNTVAICNILREERRFQSRCRSSLKNKIFRKRIKRFEAWQQDAKFIARFFTKFIYKFYLYIFTCCNVNGSHYAAREIPLPRDSSASVRTEQKRAQTEKCRLHGQKCARSPSSRNDCVLCSFVS